MVKENIVVGLDVGTHSIKVAVGKVRADQMKPQIIGTETAPSFGMRRGTMVDLEEVSANIKKVVSDVEKVIGEDIMEAFVGFGGSGIICHNSRGVVIVSRADQEVSEDDINRAIIAAKAISLPQNREILHSIPRQFFLDGQEGIKDPRGMSGIRLEVDALMVEVPTPAIKSLSKAFNDADIDIKGIILNTQAASDAVLSKRQKELGVLLLDIGAATTSLMVVEESVILHACVLPIGGSHITNDLAIGLRTSVDIAERLKLEYGSVDSAGLNKKDTVDLSKISEEEDLVVSRKQVVDIIEARVDEILDLVQKELKKVDRQGLLPSGVVLIGGTAKLPGIVAMVKRRLGLPTQIGYPKNIDGVMEQAGDPVFATAVGLVIAGSIEEPSGGFSDYLSVFKSVKKVFDKVKKLIKNFIP